MLKRQSLGSAFFLFVLDLDLAPDKAAQNAVDELRHLRCFVLLGDLHRLADSRALGISAMYKISYMATRMMADATSEIRSNRQPCAYFSMSASSSAACSATPDTSRRTYSSCFALGISAYNSSSAASSAKRSALSC